MLECNDGIKINIHKNSRYERRDAIGVGGFGVIYLAIDKDTSEKVAIKVLKLKNKEKEFLQELNIVNQIKHQSVISILDTFHSNNGALCAVMKYAEGGSVLSDIVRHGKYTEDKTRLFMKSILEGLEATHQKGIIHNDIKAANILINKNTALLADFGASIDTKTGTLQSTKGSPHWMSPEAASGVKLTTKSDIWSIGILTIEMITGKPLMSTLPGASVLLVLKETKKIYGLNSIKVSDVCMSFIKMCLQSNPRNRPTASELFAHPFISCHEKIFFQGKQESSFSNDYHKYVKIAHDIENKTIDQESISITTDFIADAFHSLKCSNDIEASLLLLEVVALCSTHFCMTNYQDVLENLLKIESNRVFANEARKILYLVSINARSLIDNDETTKILEKIGLSESPLHIIYISTKNDITKPEIDCVIKFIANFRYEKILSDLTLFYSFVNIPNKLKIMLEKQMHKYAKESLTHALQIISKMKLTDGDMTHLASMLDNYWALDFLSFNNMKILFTIMNESFIDALTINQQRKLAISLILRMKTLFFSNQEKETIDQMLNILIHMKKLDIGTVLNKQIVFWKIIESSNIEIISNICVKYPEEFDQNINADIILQRFNHMIKNISTNENDFAHFVKIINYSRMFQLRLINNQLFDDLVRTIPQYPLELQNYGLEMIQILMRIDEKPEKFRLCLIGPLTRMKNFSKNKTAEIMLHIIKQMR